MKRINLYKFSISSDSSNTTSNLNLEKPNSTDKYNIDVQNNNMDKIDTAIKTLQDKITGMIVTEDIDVTITETNGIMQLFNGVGKDDIIILSVIVMSNYGTYNGVITPYYWENTSIKGFYGMGRLFNGSVFPKGSLRVRVTYIDNTKN